MRRLAGSSMLAAAFLSPLVVLAAPVAQVQLDRIVVRVGGRAITSLDIRQARALRLVDDTSSDASVQQALENRLLALGEAARASVAASDAAVTARRNAWEGRVGGPDAARRLMSEHEMTDGDLTAWVRDDERIAQLLERQVGALPAPDRARAINDWFSRLRQRADLR
jgi:hypothetical protein